MDRPSDADRPGAREPSGRVVLAVSALSLLLNLAGLTWGLPARWHPDEKADVVLKMAREGSLSPDSFINPSLPLYAIWPLVFVQDQAARSGVAGGMFADPLLAGRALSALAGALAVLLLGLVARRHAPGLGILPALLLALFPALVNLCHFATPEAWLMLGTVATLGLCLDHLDGRASALRLGLVLGLTCSTKYTAAALAVPALAAVLLREDEASASRPRNGLIPVAAFACAGVLALVTGVALLGNPGTALATQLHLKDARLLHPESALGFVRSAGRAAALLGGGLLALAAASRIRSRLPTPLAHLARPELLVLLLAAGAGFLLGSPYAAFRPQAFLSDLAYNAQTRVEYKGLTGEATSFLPYLALLEGAMTLPALAAAVVGLLVALASGRRSPKALVIALAFVAPYLLVAASGHRALRFLAASLPAAAWLGALAVTSLRDRRARRLVTASLVARVALAALLVVRLFFVDSRLLAARFLEQHVPEGSSIDLIANHAGYAPAVPEGRVLRIVPTLSREMAPVERFVEAARRYPEEASPWLLLTASFYERFLDHPDQQPERAAFFRELLEGRGGFSVEAHFQQTGFWRPANEFLDPEIVVLKRRPPP